VTGLVIDASAMGAYLLPDEDSELLPGLSDALASERLVVPAHWQFEVANLAVSALRRLRIGEGELPGLGASLRALDIEVDPLSGADAWDSVMALALAHRLTIYDAAYLALAKRRGLVLATLDRRLIEAARMEKAPLLGQ